MNRNKVAIKLLADGLGGVEVMHKTFMEISEDVERIIKKYPDKEGCNIIEIFVSLTTSDSVSNIEYYSLTYKDSSGHETIRFDTELNEVKK